MNNVKMIPLTISEIQKISLDILKKIDEICCKLNLRYVLTYGTLLGAVRHNGYIPWDDDVDIMMPRPDYEKLLEYIKVYSRELYPLCALNSQTTPHYPYIITRISNSEYWLDTQNEKKCGMGIFIDIYPLDGLGNNFKKAEKIMTIAKGFSSLAYLSTRKYLSFKGTKSLKKNVMKPFAFIFSKIMGKTFFEKKLLGMAYLYEYDKSEFVGCVVWERELFKRTDIDNMILHDFEECQFWIPKNYHEILTSLYGDYMQLPPVNEREPHHLYSAYKK